MTQTKQQSTPDLETRVREALERDARDGSEEFWHLLRREARGKYPVWDVAKVLDPKDKHYEEVVAMIMQAIAPQLMEKPPENVRRRKEAEARERKELETETAKDRSA